VTFGVETAAAERRTLASAPGFNDGQWHHVVASMSTAGMLLYVDGALVGGRADTVVGRPYNGFLRFGGDTSWDGADYFAGNLDEVALYLNALSPDRVARHHVLGSTGSPANVAPIAAFGATTTNLLVATDAGASVDPDGSVASYAWDFGDGATAAGRTASHSYATAGTYTVRLTVTDDDGAVATATRSVVVAAAPNQGPTASFTHTESGLTVSVDADAADADGTVTSYAWDFGDGQTGTGETASHTYAAAGTYTVTLTVTDDDGATATSSSPVTVAAPAVAPLAVDGFERTVTSGFGAAQTGGNWSVSGPAGSTSVSAGRGHLQLAAAGGSAAAWLNAVSARDVTVQAGLSLDQAPTGGGTYAYLVARRASNNHYRAAVRFLSTGGVTLGLSRVVSGAETSLGSVALPGTYSPGSVLQVRLEVAGDATASLRAKAWLQGTAEPADWSITRTDSTAVLRNPGAVSISSYLAGSATRSSRIDVDDFLATPPGGAAPPPANAAPTASFAHTEAGLSVSVDADATDADGSIASYAWNFGDGQSGTGETASHTYAAAGTYTVTLTVTDDDGATATVTAPVTVAATGPTAPAPLAVDAFERTVTSGFGTAQTGGNWSVSGPSGSTSVSAGRGHLLMSAAGGSAAAWLNAVSARDVTVQAAFTLDQAPTGGGTYAYVVARRAGQNHYRAAVRFLSTGGVTVALTRVVSNAETSLGSMTLPGVSWTPGAVLQVRFDVAGQGTTTLRAKAWLQGSPEPADWSITRTDTTAVLQAAGAVGVSTYLAGSATRASRVDVDDLSATPPGTAAPANAAPTASFAATPTGLSVAVDASGSSDPDGQIASYAWTFGDGQSGTGATTSHAYAAAGTYTVGLTVTDDDGATATTTRSVTVTAPAANQAPTASFAHTESGLTVSVDADAADSDGTIASYAWNFGDGQSGTGETASHTYAAAGTYTVTLTVTDDDGATATSSALVTVTAPTGPPPLAADAFERTVTSGFGPAQTGGNWSVSGPAGSTSVSGGQGHLLMSTAGGSAAAWLNGVSARDVAVQVALQLDQAPTGGGTYAYLVARRAGQNHYRAAVRFLSTGGVSVALTRVVSNAETSLGSVTLPGVTYTPGAVLQVRFDVAGNGTTTLRAKAWLQGTPEPVDWTITRTDTTAVLQAAGAVGVSAYLAGSATRGSQVDVDDFWAGPAGSARP
jgi:PKD repeat protein